MRPKLKSPFARSPREFWILARALTAVTSARLALAIMPLAKVRRMVWLMLSAERPLPIKRRCSEDEVIRAVVSAGKHCPIGSTCLATALVGQALLHRHGHTAQLRIGVRREAGRKFEAHAWLERHEKVVLGGPSTLIGSYTRMPEMEHLIQ